MSEKKKVSELPLYEASAAPIGVALVVIEGVTYRLPISRLLATGGVSSVNDVFPDSSGAVVIDAENIEEGVSHKFMTAGERTKLASISAGAEVNVNTDWNASSGDAQLLNKPNIPSSANWNDKESTSNKGVPNGYASLNSSGVIPSTQLPSYVDDVLEFANLASFPTTGDSGKIYVDVSTNKSYRWSGSIYVRLDDSVALGETSSTAYRGDRGKTAYDHSQATGNPHGTTASDVGAYTQAQTQALVYKRRTFGDSDYTVLNDDREVVTSAALTANRTVTLPTGCPAGWEIVVADEFQAVGTYTILITVTSGKKLNGATGGTETIAAAGGHRRFLCDGNGNWIFDKGIARTSGATFTGPVYAPNLMQFTVRQFAQQPTTPITGTLSESMLYSEKMAGSSYNTIDGFSFFTQVYKGGSLAGTMTVFVKINTTNSLAGAVQIAQLGPNGAGTTHFPIRRNMRIAGGLLRGLTFNQSTQSDEAVSGSPTESTTAYNVANDYWIIVSVQMNSTSDSAYMAQLKINR